MIGRIITLILFFTVDRCESPTCGNVVLRDHSWQSLQNDLLPWTSCYWWLI